MQINRLFGIVYFLLEQKNTTAKALAERFEVSVRTIYRDIDALCSAGVPIYMNQGKGGGIALLDGFVLNKSVLSEKEQNDILLALQNLSATQYPDVGGVLLRLSSLFKKSGVSWIEADFSPWGSDARQKALFGLLRSAVIGSRVILFDYFSAAGEKSARTAEPVKLVFKDRAWYLYAYCRGRQAFRTFKITRMTNVRITEETFERRTPEEAPAASDAPPSPERIDLRLKIAPSGAYRVYDDFDEKDVVKHADGSFTVSASLPDGDWLDTYLLSFGTTVEGIEPQSLRDRVAAKLRRMADALSEQTPF